VRPAVLAKEYDLVIPALPWWASVALAVVMAAVLLLVIWLIVRKRP
jgi:hypothetical protein